MALRIREDVDKLKTPHLDVVLHLKGVFWGPNIGTALEKVEKLWRLLSENSEVNAAPVCDTFYEAALDVVAMWQVGTWHTEGQTTRRKNG